MTRACRSIHLVLVAGFAAAFGFVASEPTAASPASATNASTALASSSDRPQPSQALLDLMAKGKLETDLGRYDQAIRALRTLAQSPDATPELRAEALVRLGAARRAAGDAEGAFTAFDRAAKDPGLDRDSKSLLVRAVGGVVPGADRWAKIWPQVSFMPDRSDPTRPTLAILWPGVPHANPTHEGTPISLHFQDGDLQDIFRLFADISGLNVVVHPGIGGHANLKVHEEPWRDVLERILSANGLAYSLEGNVLLIARPEQLGPPRHFSGKPIDVDWGPDTDPTHPGRGRDLREALAEIAAVGGATVVLDPTVQGGMIFKLNEVPWDQVFDLVVRVNGLEWTRAGRTLRVSVPPQPTTSR